MADVISEKRQPHTLHTAAAASHLHIMMIYIVNYARIDIIDIDIEEEVVI